jgi:predicted nucleotidyltransferase
MNKVVQEKLPDLVQVCSRNGIARLELFGSAARDDFQIIRIWPVPWMTYL